MRLAGRSGGRVGDWLLGGVDDNLSVMVLDEGCQSGPSSSLCEGGPL